MLAARGRGCDVLGVQLVRRGDVDGIHARVGAQLRHRAVVRRAEILRELLRASGRGSAAATRRTRGSAIKVGSIRVKPRPSPATPRRMLRSDMRPHRSITSSCELGARDADHDLVCRARSRQHEVAMVRLAGQERGPAGAAGAALAGARHLVARRRASLPGWWCRPGPSTSRRAGEPHRERTVVGRGVSGSLKASKCTADATNARSCRAPHPSGRAGRSNRRARGLGFLERPARDRGVAPDRPRRDGA